MSIRLRSAKELQKVAGQLALSRPERVWLLSGPLGAGKTTFVRGFLRALGVRKVVSSPTFVLARHYVKPRGWDIALHLDGYRVKSEDELAALELPDLLQHKAALVFIEWPEYLPWVEWPGAIRVQFQIAPPGRQITLRPWTGGQLRSRSTHRPRSSRRR